MYRGNKWLSWRTHNIVDLFKEDKPNPARILGWIVSKDVVGGLIFMRIRDGSGTIQCAASKSNIPQLSFENVKDATIESAVALEGEIRDDQRAPGGRELKVVDFTIIAKADKWPITKSAIQSSSYLYDKRHLSIRGQKEAAIMRIRAEMVHATFEFFSQRGFTLVNAPSMVQSACEGGSTLFEIDYFGQKAYLTQSAQLYEEAAIEAFEKVFIFQPAFRAEKSKTSKHLTEFWMIEAEQAFADHEDNMVLQEDLLHSICTKVCEKRSGELSILGRKFEPPKPPFPRITYEEARDLASGFGYDFESGEDPSTEAERALSLHHDTPFFITDYPLSARSFYHMTKDDGITTLSSDLIAPSGYGEIATGGQRIHDYDTLVERIKKQDMVSNAFEWYLDLRRYGVPPHSGFGLGIERTVRWICGLKHIRATTLFPRTISRITP